MEGYGSGRPKNLRIRIGNTVVHTDKNLLFMKEWWLSESLDNISLNINAVLMQCCGSGPGGIRF